MLYDNGNESGIPNQVVFNASSFQRKQVVFNASCFHNRFHIIVS